MAKFILSIRDEAFNLLSLEAKSRDVTVQQSLRAVVVPDWIEGNIDGKSLTGSVAPQQPTTRTRPRHTNRMLLSPVNRLRV